jgi:hypothetical protein
MAKSGEIKIGDIDIATAVIAYEAIDCFCGKEQSKTSQPKQLVSCTGGTFWGKQGEPWPTSSEGEPLIPWLQIVCTEMTSLYGAFFKRKAVCFYIRHDMDEAEALSDFDAADFVVREYGLGDELVPLSRPKGLKGHPFRQVVWKKSKDYPGLSKYHGLFEKGVYGSLCKIKNFKYENQSGIKIGGWPTPVQRGQEYPGSHDLQIDMTENYMYGDSGVGHLSRKDGRWYLVFECS